VANRPWLEKVRELLARHALPPAYIRRFMDELADHIQDIMEENMSTVANIGFRLGEPEFVAESAAAAYRRRSFIGRHPWAAFFVFAISPIVSFVAIEAIVICLFAIAVSLFGEEKAFLFAQKIGIVGEAVVPYLLAFFTVAIPSLILSVVYCRLAKRLCIRKKWMCASCISLSTFAALLCWSVKFSDTPGQNALMLGLWLPGLSGWMPSLRSLGQCILPLVIGVWFLWAKQEKDKLSLDSST
jgi:hypothetical protein